MASAWDHYDSAERPGEASAGAQQAAVPETATPISVHQGDILHIDGVAYVVTGTVALGASDRELTLPLRLADA